MAAPVSRESLASRCRALTIAVWSPKNVPEPSFSLDIDEASPIIRHDGVRNRATSGPLRRFCGVNGAAG